MARPDDDNVFGLSGVRDSLDRAHAVEKRHESHTTMEKIWSITEGAAYGSVIVGSLTIAPAPLVLQGAFAVDPRLRRINLAVDRSLALAPQLILNESLGVGHALLSGIIPMLGNLAMYAGGGAIVGGVIGAVGGLGVLDEATIPGGLLCGFEAGLMIGGFIGLKDLLLEAAKRLHLFINYSIDGAELAWYAGDGRTVSEDQDINAAARLFAVAISELWWVILQALIAYVMKRVLELGGKAAGAAIEGTVLEKALAEACEKSAKFGKPFTDWFRNNFNKIKTAVETRQKALKQLEEGDAAGTGDASSADTQAAGASGTKPPKPKSLREQYVGRTPGKNSRTGQAVQARMRAEGTLRDGPEGTEFKASDGEWYPLEDADMAHKTDAVKWWNETGRQYGPKSPEVRQWMLDPDNYTLDHYSINRSAGAKLPDGYLPPLE